METSGPTNNTGGRPSTNTRVSWKRPSWRLPSSQTSVPAAASPESPASPGIASLSPLSVTSSSAMSSSMTSLLSSSLPPVPPVSPTSTSPSSSSLLLDEQLYKLVTQKNWHRVVRCCQQGLEPERSSSTTSSSPKSQRRISTRSTTEDNSVAAVVIDHYRASLLHVACQKCPPVRAIRALLDLYHDLPTLPCPAHGGELALHAAARYNASLDVLKALVKDHPATACYYSNSSNNNNNATSAAGAGATGKTPVRVLWDARDTTHSNQMEENYGTIFWQKVQVLLEAVARHLQQEKDNHHHHRNNNNSDSDNNSHTSKLGILHAAVYLTTLDVPPSVVDYALDQYPGQVSLPDAAGRLPLHVAVGPTQWTDKWAQQHHNLRQQWHVIGPLLEVYPQAAAIKDPTEQGRYPLHTALWNKHTWRCGVRELFENYPEAIYEVDPITGFYAFQLAAVARKQGTIVDLDSIYYLLRGMPGVMDDKVLSWEDIMDYDDDDNDNGNPYQVPATAPTKTTVERVVVSRLASVFDRAEPTADIHGVGEHKITRPRESILAKRNSVGNFSTTKNAEKMAIQRPRATVVAKRHSIGNIYAIKNAEKTAYQRAKASAVAATEKAAVERTTTEREAVERAVAQRMEVAEAAEHVDAEKVALERTATEKAAARNMAAAGRVASVKAAFEAAVQKNGNADKAAAAAATDDVVEYRRVGSIKGGVTVAIRKSLLVKSNAERAATEKLVSAHDKLGAVAEKLTAERLSDEMVANGTVTTRKVAIEKAATKVVATENVPVEKISAQKFAAEKVIVETVEIEKFAAEKFAAEKVAAEKIATETMAAQMMEAENLTFERMAADRLAAKKLAAITSNSAAKQLAAQTSRLAAEKVKLTAEKRQAEQALATTVPVEKVSEENDGGIKTPKAKALAKEERKESAETPTRSRETVVEIAVENVSTTTTVVNSTAAEPRGVSDSAQTSIPGIEKSVQQSKTSQPATSETAVEESDFKERVTANNIVPTSNCFDSEQTGTRPSRELSTSEKMATENATGHGSRDESTATDLNSREQKRLAAARAAEMRLEAAKKKTKETQIEADAIVSPLHNSRVVDEEKQKAVENTRPVKRKATSRANARTSAREKVEARNATIVEKEGTDKDSAQQIWTENIVTGSPVAIAGKVDEENHAVGIIENTIGWENSTSNNSAPVPARGEIVREVVVASTTFAVTNTLHNGAVKGLEAGEVQCISTETTMETCGRIEQTGVYDMIVDDIAQKLGLASSIVVANDEEAVAKDLEAAAKDEKGVANDEEAVANKEEAVANDEKAEANDQEAVANNQEAVANDEEVVANDEEAVANNQEAVTNDEEAVANDEEAVANDEEAVANDEEAVANDEEVVANDEEVVANDEEAVANDEEGVANDEKVVANDEEAVANDEEAVAKDEEAVANDEEAVANDEEAVANKKTNNEEGAPKREGVETCLPENKEDGGKLELANVGKTDDATKATVADAIAGKTYTAVATTLAVLSGKHSASRHVNETEAFSGEEGQDEFKASDAAGLHARENNDLANKDQEDVSHASCPLISDEVIIKESKEDVIAQCESSAESVTTDADEEYQLAMEMAMFAMRNSHLPPDELRRLSRRCSAPNVKTDISFLRSNRGSFFWRKSDDMSSREAKSELGREKLRDNESIIFDRALPRSENTPSASSATLISCNRESDVRSVKHDSTPLQNANNINNNLTELVVMTPPSRKKTRTRISAADVMRRRFLLEMEREIEQKRHKLESHREQGERRAARHMLRRGRMTELRDEALIETHEKAKKLVVSDHVLIDECISALEQASAKQSLQVSLEEKTSSENSDELKYLLERQTMEEAELVRQMLLMLALERQLSLLKKHNREIKRYLQKCKLWLQDDAALTNEMAFLQQSTAETKKIYAETLQRQDAAIGKFSF